MKSKEEKIRENIEKFEEEINKRKKLPENSKKQIKKSFLINFSKIVFCVIFFMILAILEENLPTDTYLQLLRVLSIVMIGVTIIMLEISYKTNKNSMILNTVEILVVTFFIMFLIPAYSLYYGQFFKVMTYAIIIAVIYYILKIIINIKRTRKQYYKNFNDIETIVAKK